MKRKISVRLSEEIVERLEGGVDTRRGGPQNT